MEDVARDFSSLTKAALGVAIYVHKRCYGQDEFDISIRDCARFLRAKRDTVQRGFAELLSGGHLERLPDRRLRQTHACALSVQNTNGG